MVLRTSINHVRAERDAFPAERKVDLLFEEADDWPYLILKFQVARGLQALGKEVSNETSSFLCNWAFL
jgi:hypothetical protein